MSKLMTVSMLCLALGAWLCACETTTDAPPVPDTVDVAELVEPAVEAPIDEAVPEAIGGGMSAALGATSLVELAADPAQFEGQTVRIEGTATSRCGSGCSLTLTAGESTFKLKSDPETLQFPAGWVDQIIMAEGEVKADGGCAKHKDQHAEHAETEYVLWITSARMIEQAAPATEG